MKYLFRPNVLKTSKHKQSFHHLEVSMYSGRFTKFLLMFSLLMSASISNHSLLYAQEKDQPKNQEPTAQEQIKKEDPVQDQAASKKSSPYQPKTIRPIPNLNVKNLLILPIHETVEPGLAAFVKRNLEEHQNDVDAIILDVDTLGGRVDSALAIKDAILAVNKPVIAYINRRAISAGALISFAADYIVFSDASSMGAATPIQMDDDGGAKAVGEKMVSYFRAEMKTTAEANGWDGQLAEAMVDSDVAIEGVIEKGKLLTVSNQMAVSLGLCNAQINTLDALIEKISDPQAKPRLFNASENWAEEIARFVTDPTVAGFLMSLGMLGLMIEFYTPGFGLAGMVGFLCLGLFFGGHTIVNLAGALEVTIFLIGVMMLIVEIFIIPGFGIVGMLGLLMIAIGMILAMAESPLGEWEFDLFVDAITIFSTSFIVTVMVGLILLKYLPKSSFASWMVLKENLDHVPEELPESIQVQDQLKVGDIGLSMTALRKYGSAKFFDKTIEVVSEHEYIDANEKIEIIRIHSNTVTVKKVTENQ
jgi:membrane-bound serine protease (ClpP class)